MRASIYSNLNLIGHADLKVGDEGKGCVYGEFVPNAAYYDKIQKSVWEFWQTDNLKKWHALRFNAQLDNGFFLFPIGGYTIDDSPEFPDEPKRIDIAGLYRHVIEDFFQSEPSRPFVEEPWTSIDVQQKISLEAELQAEIGENFSSFLNSLNFKAGHVLTKFEVSALATTLQSDDVLFAVHNDKDYRKEYAVVHLTWKQKKEENPSFPVTTFYESFDQFKLERVYPDKADWEY